MAGEDSSSTSQQLTLDQISFEKLLAAAWVLQCVHDQTHASKAKQADSLEGTRRADTGAQIASSELQSAFQFSAHETRADSRRETRVPAPVNHRLFVEPVEIEQPVSSPIFNLAAEEINMQTAPRSAVVVQDGFSSTPAVPSSHLPRVRVNLKPRGLRAVGIATPVWVLSLVAVLLFFEVWRHDSNQNAQTTSQPIPSPILKPAVTNTSPAASPPAATNTVLPIKKPAVSKKVAKAPQLSKGSSPLQVSHKQITDPATFFFVHQLSRYEIETLSRQAKYGDASAAFALGMAYEVGHFVPQDCREAARWVKIAAEEGNAAAQYNIGLRYRDGDGVPVNLGLSATWRHQAAIHTNKRFNSTSKLFASR